MKKILFVCLGNICRSPTAHAIGTALADRLGIKVVIESAGTSAYHQGSAPDSRAIACALKQGYDLRDLQAQPVQDTDYYEFDYILAMDNNNYKALIDKAPSDAKAIIERICDYHPDPNVTFIPDPYYDENNRGFEKNITLLETAITEFFTRILR